LGFKDYSYPCEKYRYNKIVGKLLPRLLKSIFVDFGFNVKVNPIEGNDVGMWIYWNNELVLVVEVLNWSIRSRLGTKRKRGMQVIYVNMNAIDWLFSQFLIRI